MMQLEDVPKWLKMLSLMPSLMITSIENKEILINLKWMLGTLCNKEIIKLLVKFSNKLMIGKTV